MKAKLYFESKLGSTWTLSRFIKIQKYANKIKYEKAYKSKFVEHDPFLIVSGF